MWGDVFLPLVILGLDPLLSGLKVRMRGKALKALQFHLLNLIGTRFAVRCRMVTVQPHFRHTGLDPVSSQTKSLV